MACTKYFHSKTCVQLAADCRRLRAWKQQGSCPHNRSMYPMKRGKAVYRTRSGKRLRTLLKTLKSHILRPSGDIAQSRLQGGRNALPGRGCKCCDIEHTLNQTRHRFRPSVSASVKVEEETPYMTSCCKLSLSMGSVIRQHRPSVPLPARMSNSGGQDSI